MSDFVQFTKIDGIAVVAINNPPVNALSSAVSAGIAAAVAQIEKDDTVKAVVFVGAGRTFIAGADIKEFAPVSMWAGAFARNSATCRSLGFAKRSSRTVSASSAASVKKLAPAGTSTTKSQAVS